MLQPVPAAPHGQHHEGATAREGREGRGCVVEAACPRHDKVVVDGANADMPDTVPVIRGLQLLVPDRSEQHVTDNLSAWREWVHTSWCS